MTSGSRKYKSRPLQFNERTQEEMVERSREFLEEMRTRRTVRQYSDRSIPREALINCIETASQAPSGANKQPWTFVLVTDPKVKKQIRVAAEKEERELYRGRAPESWLRDLEALGTDEHKPFLEAAPALIAIFAQKHGKTRDEQHYYVNESVGIAVGFLLAALHHAGFASLTHTPSPMKFLSDILDRPENERPYLLIPVGYPAQGCRVPDIDRKPLDRVLVER
jgi:iodotyrosine deiodinase